MKDSDTSLGSVLLIDDSKTDNFINTKVLELSGKATSIHAFETAANALAFLANAEVFPDLILLDVYMPIMNGFDFLEEYNQLPDAKKKNTKVLLISSAYDTIEIEKLKKYKWVSGYIVKPLTYESLDSI